MYIITTGTAAPTPDLDAKAKKDDFETLFKRTFKRKIASVRIQKICLQITVAALMQPLQYYLRDPAAKDNSITHATMRPADTALRNTKELRATASEIAAPKPDLDAKAKKQDEAHEPECSHVC